VNDNSILDIEASLIQWWVCDKMHDNEHYGENWCLCGRELWEKIYESEEQNIQLNSLF